MNARGLTGSALASALKKAFDPAISAALRRNAERLRAVVEEDRDAHSGRGEGSAPSLGFGGPRSGLSLDVAVSGENLFAREFGALDAAADPVIAPAIDRLKRIPR
jgi:hypothetical protein